MVPSARPQSIFRLLSRRSLKYSSAGGCSNSTYTIRISYIYIYICIQVHIHIRASRNNKKAQVSTAPQLLLQVLVWIEFLHTGVYFHHESLLVVSKESGENCHTCIVPENNLSSSIPSFRTYVVPGTCKHPWSR